MTQRRIGITLGDPGGIGAEVILKALAQRTDRTFLPVVFGDAWVLDYYAKLLGVPYSPRVVGTPDELAKINSKDGALVDVQTLDSPGFAGLFCPGRIDANFGLASYAYINRAIDWALAGHVDAVVTAPIHKESLHQGGIGFPGHTEIFADRTGTQEFCMMLTSQRITCSLVTTHVGLSEIFGLLSTERILEVIRLSGHAMQRMRGREPRMIVCGLNPHAGEHGLFGNSEEEQIIAPAVELARREGWNVTGPLSPDTAFVPNQLKEADCHICMYHDQGLIPLKALAFDQAVNVTLGLPIIRTSVDHGTAFDIVGRNQASPSSMLYAIEMAVRLC